MYDGYNDLVFTAKKEASHTRKKELLVFFTLFIYAKP